MKKCELRRQQILIHLIDDFIENNEPLSSGALSKKYLKNVSPATIRIDLNILEKANFIYQPHPSAGRIPTVLGYREYLKLINDDLKKAHFNNEKVLLELLISQYDDTSSLIHYIIQFLSRETENLSFVAEPEIAFGYLKKLDVFKISKHKLLFVVSLDSGLDKTIIINCDYDISANQLKALVRYMNDELAGLMLYDIQNKYLKEVDSNLVENDHLLNLFLNELERVFDEISNYYINFDGNINFLEQPEFESKREILTFLSLTQRQDILTSLMKKTSIVDGVGIILGEDFGNPDWSQFVLIFSKYDIFGVPGFLGILSPIRMNYKKNIPIIKGIAETITRTTKKGIMVKVNEK